MNEKHEPGPWRLEPWSGGQGHRPGIYVARSVYGGTEWLKDEKRRIACFPTEDAARAAIAKAGQS